jgi:hypothetical protein
VSLPLVFRCATFHILKRSNVARSVDDGLLVVFQCHSMKLVGLQRLFPVQHDSRGGSARSRAARRAVDGVVDLMG